MHPNALLSAAPTGASGYGAFEFIRITQCHECAPNPTYGR